MFSYQHSYHAAGPADVVKHALLALLLERMVAKPKPLTYYETHAGRGVYNLASAEALKTGEFHHGIARIWPHRAAAPSALHAYLSTMSEPLSAYPGSPDIALRLLREADSLHLCEAHPQEAEALREAMAGDRRVTLHQADGPATVPGLLTPAGRALVMVDPSYERQQEYAATATTVAAVLKAAPKAVVMIWYPLLPEGRHVTLLKGLEALGVPATLQAELAWRQGAGRGAYGTGQIILNLPYRLEEEIDTAMAWLLPHLASEGGEATMRLGFLHAPR